MVKLDATRGETNISIRGESLPDRATFRLALLDATGFTPNSVVHPSNPDVPYREAVRVIIRNATSDAPGSSVKPVNETAGVSTAKPMSSNAAAIASTDAS